MTAEFTITVTTTDPDLAAAIARTATRQEPTMPDHHEHQWADNTTHDDPDTVLACTVPGCDAEQHTTPAGRARTDDPADDSGRITGL